jgi:transcriptional regulator with XRE-family HTH domain
MENPSEIKAAIARNLRRLREERRLSRRFLAQLARASRFELQEIEAGRILPDIGLIVRLAGALDASCADFLAGANEAHRMSSAGLGGRNFDQPVGRRRLAIGSVKP